ncbi:DNA replication protein DnaC, partial [Clostridium sp. HV4-5-A1G]
MIKSYHSQIIKMYEKIREEDEKSLNIRKEEIRRKLPEIIDIQRSIGKLSLELSINILNNVENKDKYLKELKEKITDLRIRKSELLAINNYPVDYLEIHYQCPKCKDTGFIGHQKCSCYKQKLIKLYYNNSDLIN